ncbi:hypothetical protein U1Q18_029026 [Sarracenia purpurea var. burkii]
MYELGMTRAKGVSTVIERERRRESETAGEEMKILGNYCLFFGDPTYLQKLRSLSAFVLQNLVDIVMLEPSHFQTVTSNKLEIMDSTLYGKVSFWIFSICCILYGEHGTCCIANLCLGVNLGNGSAWKMNLEKLTYHTVQSGALLLVFRSSLVFNGVTYSDEPGRNKKEAEQLAARVKY